MDAKIPNFAFDKTSPECECKCKFKLILSNITVVEESYIELSLFLWRNAR